MRWLLIITNLARFQGYLGDTPLGLSVRMFPDQWRPILNTIRMLGLKKKRRRGQERPTSTRFELPAVCLWMQRGSHSCHRDGLRPQATIQKTNPSVFKLPTSCLFLGIWIRFGYKIHEHTWYPARGKMLYTWGNGFLLLLTPNKMQT